MTGRFLNQDAIFRLTRYGIVGLTVNGVGYLLYLLLTSRGMEPKATMTLLYLVVAGLGFWGNKLWSFRHSGGYFQAALRYVAAHIIGYLTNLALLVVAVDLLGYPHQLVQFASIFVVALMLFLLFNFFVFPKSAASPEKK